MLSWFATAFSDAANHIFQDVLALYVLKLAGSSTAYAALISIVVMPKLFSTPLAECWRQVSKAQDHGGH